MCQATAFYLGHNIHIVGTANTGQGLGYTKLESVEGADQFQPLYIGYYQGQHYQSLKERLPRPMDLGKMAENGVFSFSDLSKISRDMRLKALPSLEVRDSLVLQSVNNRPEGIEDSEEEDKVLNEIEDFETLAFKKIAAVNFPPSKIEFEEESSVEIANELVNEVLEKVYQQLGLQLYCGLNPTVKVYTRNFSDIMVDSRKEG